MAEVHTGFSLVARIMLVVTLALMSGSAGVSWLVFQTATDEAEEVFDGQLAQTASLLISVAGVGNVRDSGAVAQGDDDAHTGALVPQERRFKHRLVYQVWRVGDVPRLLLRSGQAPETKLPLGEDDEDGYSDGQWQGGHWRFYRLERDGHLAIVGQDARVRAKLAHEVGEHGIGPLAMGFVATVLLAWLAIALGLRPLSRLARDVQLRAPDRLDPFDEGRRPRELAVLVGALNSLFTRVARAFANERRFTADAAHELRTPLAALTAQVQSVQTAHDEVTRNARLSDALRGLQRMARLVEQLLAVARLDAIDVAKSEAVDAAEKMRQLAGELAPGALERGVELSLDAPENVALRAQPDLLRAALRNLIENAIRHSPPGAVVELALRAEGGSLVCEIRDSGFGVPDALRTRLGERFLRGEGEEAGGAGLGLSIVRRIAELHGGRVEFDANRPQGLVARLILPIHN